MEDWRSRSTDLPLWMVFAFVTLACVAGLSLTRRDAGTRQGAVARYVNAVVGLLALLATVISGWPQQLGLGTLVRLPRRGGSPAFVGCGAETTWGTQPAASSVAASAKVSHSFLISTPRSKREDTRRHGERWAHEWWTAPFR